MKDRNGREIMMGDVVRVTGGYTKNSNGLFFVVYAPGFTGWCGKDLCLHKIRKDGALSVANYSTSSWPLHSFASSPAERYKAREWNKEHAEIEVVTDVDRTHIKAYFTEKAEKSAEADRRYADMWGAESAEVVRMRKITDEYRAIVDSIVIDAPAAPKTKKPGEQSYIKFYWNGIKVNDKKLIPCTYSIYSDGTVAIYSLDYSSDFPADLFEVRNDTDLYTDYITTDRGSLMQNHPLYKYVRYAALKDRKRSDERLIKSCDQKLAGPEIWPKYYDAITKEREDALARIAAFEKEVDPGQPKAADLEAIDRIHQAAANEKAAAEHEERLKAREKALAERNEGRAMIEAEMSKAPLQDGDSRVIINWSESLAFASWDDDELVMSVRAADRVLKMLDIKHGRGNGYDKTKFTVVWNDGAEESSYTGRYDIGDHDGGLIAHIDGYARYIENHPQLGDKDDVARRMDIVEHLRQYA